MLRTCEDVWSSSLVELAKLYPKMLSMLLSFRSAQGSRPVNSLVVGFMLSAQGFGECLTEPLSNTRRVLELNSFLDSVFFRDHSCNMI